MRIRWEKITEETQRYYEQHLITDLLGDLIVINVNGGIGRSNGAIRNHAMDNEIAALNFIEKESRRREKHGYTLKYIDF